VSRFLIALAGVAALSGSASAQLFNPLGSGQRTWIEIAQDAGGNRVSMDSASLMRSGSTFYATTQVRFAETLSSGDLVRFDQEMDVQELDCAGHRFRTMTAALLLEDSVVAQIPMPGVWQDATEAERPLLNARCSFLQNSFVMAQTPVVEIESVDRRPTLLNAREVFHAVGRMYSEVGRRGVSPPTIVVSFVIGETGLPAPETMFILSSDVARPSELMWRLVPRMRFRAAQIGGRSVRARVQIPVTFVGGIPGPGAQRSWTAPVIDPGP
jgi:hypothetical protein